MIKKCDEIHFTFNRLADKSRQTYSLKAKNIDEAVEWMDALNTRVSFFIDMKMTQDVVLPSHASGDDDGSGKMGLSRASSGGTDASGDGASSAGGGSSKSLLSHQSSSISAPHYQGWLRKKGNNVFRRWTDRYCVLDDNQFCYYEKEADVERNMRKGHIPIKNIENIKLEDGV